MEKQQIQRELEAEEKRLDQMMEVERQRSLQREEEILLQRREERLRCDDTPHIPTPHRPLPIIHTYTPHPSLLPGFALVSALGSTQHWGITCGR